MSKSKVVLFVHGLGGDAEGTWRVDERTPGLPDLVCSDAVLGAEYDVSLYGFPTSFLSIPFLARAPSITSLVGGLRTHITHRCAGFDEITIVAHSLGGLIAQKYVVDEIAAGRPLKVKKLVLYAVPNDGSSLASVGNLLPWSHRQLQALCRSSDVVEGLTKDWVRLRVTRRVAVTYITGGQDDAVARDSSQRLWDGADREELPSRGHRNLVKPVDKDDLAFVVLRSILDERRTGKVLFVLSHGQDKWVGFQNVPGRLAHPVEPVRTNLLQVKRELARASALVLAMPFHRELDTEETELVKSWVWQGGGLLLLGYYASLHHETRINTLANALDLDFGEDMILPAGIDGDGARESVFDNDIRFGLDLDLAAAPAHPILRGVTSAKVFSACSVRDLAPEQGALALRSVPACTRFRPEGPLVDGYMPVITRWVEYQRGPMPALVACTRGKGRVVAAGTWKVCTVDVADNRALVNNAISWLAGT